MNRDEDIVLTFQESTTSNDLFCQFDGRNGVLLLDVKNPFTTNDFREILRITDSHFAAHGELKGIIINAKKFPYWSSAQNRAEYLSFAGNNHYKFQKVALAMGGFFTKIVVRIARSRVRCEVKIFKHNEIKKAQSWILW